MVNRKPPGPIAPPQMGINCGECGLPGLGVHPVPVQGQPHQVVPMLICRFCHVGVRVGRVWQLSA